MEWAHRRPISHREQRGAFLMPGVRRRSAWTRSRRSCSCSALRAKAPRSSRRPPSSTSCASSTTTTASRSVRRPEPSGGAGRSRPLLLAAPQRRRAGCRKAGTAAAATRSCVGLGSVITTGAAGPPTAPARARVHATVAENRGGSVLPRPADPAHRCRVGPRERGARGKEMGIERRGGRGGREAALGCQSGGVAAPPPPEGERAPGRALW